MIVGGSWGATLALAYAQAHPDRVTGIVLRATFLGTRAELEDAFLDALPRFYPGLSDDFLERAAAGGTRAAARCLLAPHSRSRSGGARPGRPRLARHRTHSFRTYAVAGPARSRFAELDARAARHAVHGSALFPERLLHEAGPASGEAGKLAGIPGIIVQGRYDLLCPPATSHALAAAWPDAEIRIVEGAGHSLYDPGVRDAVMKAIADLASDHQAIRTIAKCRSPEKECC